MIGSPLQRLFCQLHSGGLCHCVPAEHLRSDLVCSQSHKANIGRKSRHKRLGSSVCSGPQVVCSESLLR
jgi:hypothetical protein